MRTIPVDSTDAREQRELEQERAAAEQADARRHDQACRGGWLGEDSDGRPIPCTRCRPWLAYVACRTCSAPFQACTSLQSIGRGSCCPDCNHQPDPSQGGGSRAGRRPGSTTEEITDAPKEPPTQAAQTEGSDDGVDPVRETLRGPRAADRDQERDPVTAEATPEQLAELRVMPAKALNSPDLCERAFRTVVVTDPDAGAVRWRIKADARAWRWRCAVHGTTTGPDCEHTFSAAIHLAEDLLGLTRLPALEPKDLR